MNREMDLRANRGQDEMIRKVHGLKKHKYFAQ